MISQAGTVKIRCMKPEQCLFARVSMQALFAARPVNIFLVGPVYFYLLALFPVYFGARERDISRSTLVLRIRQPTMGNESVWTLAVKFHFRVPSTSTTGAKIKEAYVKQKK